MSRFYKNEDFTVEFTAGTDITGATAEVKYKAPDGTVTSVAATITSAAAGEFEAAIADTDLTLAGPYKFWAKITDQTGNITISEPISVEILEEGQP